MVRPAAPRLDPALARHRSHGDLYDSERGTVRIEVTSRTRFERIAGFSGLRAGMRSIESVVRRSNGRWVALEVERSSGGGRHGGDD